MARAGLALSLAGRRLATAGLDDRSARGYVREESLPVGGLTELASSYNRIVKNSLRKGPTQPYSNVRGSFLILNRTPWSPKERERKVDSAMPGKFFDA